jgi:hypothetical protein
MGRRLLYTLLVVLIFFSCKREKPGTLIGAWRAVKLENPEMDSFFMKSQMFIDTMGNTHDDELNMRLYGITNMDSMRVIMQQQYDSARAIQREGVTNTVFTFRADSVAVLAFNGVVDSGRWFFLDEHTMVIDPFHKTDQNEKVEMEVLALSDTLLKLKMMDEDTYSTVTFKPEQR